MGRIAVLVCHAMLFGEQIHQLLSRDPSGQANAVRLTVEIVHGDYSIPPPLIA
jgi:hypothetical protein